jgi:hypothetical protein
MASKIVWLLSDEMNSYASTNGRGISRFLTGRIHRDCEPLVLIWAVFLEGKINQMRKFFVNSEKKWVKNCKNLQKCALF